MICGENVFLRAVEFEDSRIISAWLNDRETNEYLDIVYPLSKRYADTFVLEAEENNKKVLIIDNLDRKPIGFVIIDEIKWEYRTCSIGIVIYNKNFRGLGLGKDALSAAINFIFNNMNMHLIHLKVHEENERAIKLYKLLGFEEEGILKHRMYKDGKYGNLLSMSRIREE